MKEYSLIFEAEDVNDKGWDTITNILKENIPGFEVLYGNGNYIEFRWNIINKLPIKVQEYIEKCRFHVENTNDNIFNIVHAYLDVLIDCKIITYDEEGYIMKYIGLID